MRNLDYDLLRSTSPPNTRVATPTTTHSHSSAMSQRHSGAPTSPSLPVSHGSSHPLLPLSAQLTPTAAGSSSSSSPTPGGPATSSADNKRHLSRTPSVSSVASSSASTTGPKISPAPTTVKRRHYWNYFQPADSEMDSSNSNSSNTGQTYIPTDELVDAASGDGSAYGLSNQGLEAAPPPPPAPPPVRYTRTGQIIPEGKVMMVNGGCVGEGDWKRTNGAIQSMFEPLHHVLTHQGSVPQVLPSNGFWLRAMTDQAVLDLCAAYDIEPDPDGDARKNRAAFLNYLGATYLAAVV